MRRRLFVISNPGAGLAYSSRIAATIRVLEGAGASITRMQPDRFSDAHRLAQRAAGEGAYDVIVAAGGDGTIRHVAAALIGSDMPLGILPAGTGNVLAHEIGLALTPVGIARMLLEGPVVDVACARANDEPFLLMAGIGFDAHVLTGLDHRSKSRVGKIAYLRPLLSALQRPLETLTVTVDQQEHQACWALVTNACHYGGGFVLTPRTHVCRRGLEAILFKPKSRVGLAHLLTGIARGTLHDRATTHGDVTMLACTRVHIAAQSAVPVQIDGDVIGATPLEIDAGSAHVKLIVPAHAHRRGALPLH